MNKRPTIKDYLSYTMFNPTKAIITVCIELIISAVAAFVLKRLGFSDYKALVMLFGSLIILVTLFSFTLFETMFTANPSLKRNIKKHEKETKICPCCLSPFFENDETCPICNRKLLNTSDYRQMPIEKREQLINSECQHFMRQDISKYRFSFPGTRDIISIFPISFFLLGTIISLSILSCIVRFI